MSDREVANVLIADDDAIFRRVMEFTVRRRGWNPVVACDGQAAWECLQHGSISFLITDQQMPRMTGLELLQRKDADDSLRHIPAALCTAKGSELDTVHLRSSLGLVAVFRKPFSPSCIVEAVASILN